MYVYLSSPFLPNKAPNLPKMPLIQIPPSIPKMDFPKMPPPDLLLLSLSTAAVLVSAIGLWRIRAIGSKPDSSTCPSPPVGPTEPAPVQIPASCHVEAVGSPKVRFTVCYSADEDECHVDEEDEGDESESGGEYNRAVTGFTELVMMRRRGDLGWYSYQDRTAINGSVVRLWG